MATNAGRRKRQRASDRRTTTPLSVASLSARSERVGHCAHDEFRRGISKDVLLKDRTQPQLACLLIKSMGAADRDRLPRPTQDVPPACRPWIVGQPLRLAPARRANSNDGDHRHRARRDGCSATQQRACYLIGVEKDAELLVVISSRTGPVTRAPNAASDSLLVIAVWVLGALTRKTTLAVAVAPAASGPTAHAIGPPPAAEHDP